MGVLVAGAGVVLDDEVGWGGGGDAGAGGSGFTTGGFGSDRGAVFHGRRCGWGEGGCVSGEAYGVKAKVSGIIAEVEVVQVYANEAEVPLEAVYVFPGSTRAAVQGLEMRIGERVIRAQIQEKGAARAGYEKAKAEKKHATLLEQERPNVFQMSVANIAPGAEVEVRLTYTEVLRPTERVYEFVFPTVVGQRYAGASG